MSDYHKKEKKIYNSLKVQLHGISTLNKKNRFSWTQNIPMLQKKFIKDYSCKKSIEHSLNWQILVDEIKK